MLVKRNPDEGDLLVTEQPLSELLPPLRRRLAARPLTFLNIPDPDLGAGLYAGEVAAGGVYRSWQTWNDVAQRLEAALLTPEKLPEGRLRLGLRRLPPITRSEGYGAGSDFQRLNKLEDPWFLDTFTEALSRCRLEAGARILSVGVGSGRELDALALAYPSTPFEVWGVDRDEAVLELAAQRHAGQSWHFARGDANDLSGFGSFDLIIALSVLQNRSVNLDLALRGLLKHNLTTGGSLIVGLPNCRYAGGEVLYGARMRNFRDPDLSLLLSDAALLRRHLQKRGFQVWVTGKYEVLVTARQR